MVLKLVDFWTSILIFLIYIDILIPLSTYTVYLIWARLTHVRTPKHGVSLGLTKNPYHAHLSYNFGGTTDFSQITLMDNTVLLLPTKLLGWVKSFTIFWFGLWQINHCRLFNAKSSLYLCKYIWFVKTFLHIILKQPSIIFLQTVNLFQVLLSNSTNSIEY